MPQAARKSSHPQYREIPVRVSRRFFERFVLPCLSMPKRGPRCKIGYWKIFNYILQVLYTGMQWSELPIDSSTDGKPEIDYTSVYKYFAKWADDGSLRRFFDSSILLLYQAGRLDLACLHGDATNTVAKKGGDGISYSGHKHQRGEKIMAIVDFNGFVLVAGPVAPVNKNDTLLFPESLDELMCLVRLLGHSLDGAHLNLDGAFDSRKNRKLLFNRRMVPNIRENRRRRKYPKRGRKRKFDAALHKTRETVERMFAWEDKFRRLLLRFERIQSRHLAFKLLAYALINLRVFC